MRSFQSALSMMMAFDIIALSLFVSSNDIKAKRIDSHVGLRRKTPFVSFGNDIKNIGIDSFIGRYRP